MATPWVTIAAADVIAEGFHSTEKAVLVSIAAADDMAAIVSSAIAEWRGVIDAAGFDLDVAGTIPASCRRHITAQIRWQFLVKFSSLKQLQTEERKAEADRAQDFLDAISKGEQPIEDPIEDDEDAATGGAWGSETKVQMRSHIT